METPKIAITSALTTGAQLTPAMEVSKHASMVERAGGSPIVLYTDMHPEEIFRESKLQGIILSGGGDVAAARYDGNEALAADWVNDLRDTFEFELLQIAFARKLPVLGICRGLQVANVLLGGTLIEDLRTHLGSEYHVAHQQVRDSQRKLYEYGHHVTVVERTLLHAIALQERLPVNSSHHQSVRRLAPSLRIAGRADDGVIEAVEFAAQEDQGFFIGVQWHPEQLLEDPTTQSLYSAFLEACRAYEPWGFRDASAPGVR